MIFGSVTSYYTKTTFNVSGDLGLVPLAITMTADATLAALDPDDPDVVVEPVPEVVVVEVIPPNGDEIVQGCHERWSDGTIQNLLADSLIKPSAVHREGWYKRLVRYFDRSMITLDNQEEGLDLVDAIDDTPELVEYDPAQYGRTLTTGDRRCFAVALGQECRNAINVSEDTKANRLVAKAWIFSRMTTHGMRPSHITQTMPLAIATVFIPTIYEVDARQIETSSAVVKRITAMSDDAHGREDPTFAHPLGRKSRRNPPRVA